MRSMAIINGNNGNNVLRGTRFSDIISGLDGNDDIFGDRGDDILDGGNDDDILDGGDGNDTVIGGEGDDVLDGGRGGDSLFGGEGNDTLLAGYDLGNGDLFDGGSGVDTLVIAGTDVEKFAFQINLKTGTDNYSNQYYDIENVTGGTNHDVITGNDEDNILEGGRGHDTLNGEGGNDTLRGGRGKDELNGGNGDDILEGGSGRDVLNGGLGDDVQSGGDASDTYEYAMGDGADIIQDAGSADNDVLRISGYTPGETFIQADASDPNTLIISFGGGNSTDSITVVNTLGGSAADTIEEIEFDDGTIWNISDVIAWTTNNAPVAGDDDAGEATYETPLGIQPADLLSNDTDADLDTVSGHAVHDAVNGSVSMGLSGNITFIPDAGYSGPAAFKYTVTDGTAASEATVSVYVEVNFSSWIGNWWAEDIDLSNSALPCYIECGRGNDTLLASNLRDSIVGGYGDDTLNGGAGDDDFLIGMGDGYDRFIGGSGYDKVKATAEGVKIGLIGDFNATVEEFSCAGFANVSITGTWQWQVMDFSNVTLTDIAYIDAGFGKDTVTGSDGDDVIIGNKGDDTLNGGAGDDDFLIRLGDGFDTIDGGAGYDQILADGDNVAIGFLNDFVNAVEEISANGHADVSILGKWYGQSFDFSNVLLDGISEIDMDGGDDTAIGSTGDDTIIGGRGNDTLTGNLGSDTFVFRDEEGADTLTDFTIGADLVRFEAVDGFSDFTDVQAALSQQGADALLDLGGGHSILFEDVLASALTQDQFEFV